MFKVHSYIFKLYEFIIPYFFKYYKFFYRLFPSDFIFSINFLKYCYFIKFKLLFNISLGKIIIFLLTLF